VAGGGGDGGGAPGGTGASGVSTQTGSAQTPSTNTLGAGASTMSDQPPDQDNGHHDLGWLGLIGLAGLLGLRRRDPVRDEDRIETRRAGTVR
jgi:MYXO-CTERM domain-containing protein